MTNNKTPSAEEMAALFRRQRAVIIDAFDRLQAECALQAERQRPTNADRLRAMSDEELADQLVISLDGMAPCRMWAAPATGKMYLSGTSAARDMLAWLQQPAQEEGKQNAD